MIKINKKIFNIALDSSYSMLYQDLQETIILQGNWILAYDEKDFVVLHTDTEVISMIDNNLPNELIQRFNETNEEEREETLQDIVKFIMNSLNESFNHGNKIFKNFASLSDFIEENLINRKLNEPKYIIGINGDNESTVDDIVISSEILEEAEWEVRDVSDFLDNLENWIVEAKNRSNGDYELMKADQKMLMDYKDKYMFSSQSTNAYMLPSDNEEEFKTLCKELLKAVK